MAVAKAWCMIPYSNKKSDEVIIDMRPLVLCENCKWWKDNGATANQWVPCQEMQTPRNWFCASGEER